MKRSKETKYEYWKWLLLQKQTKLVCEKTNRKLIAVFNPVKNIIFRFDLDKNEKIETNWEGLNWLFENSINDFVTIGDLEAFYNSLPTQKKKIFWDCLSRSMK